MLDVVYGQASDPGRIRTNNEDAMGAFVPTSPHQARSHGYLFAVADGVGGLASGEIASSTAVSVLIREFEKAEPGAMLISLLPSLVQQANAAVHDGTRLRRSDGKMATTVVACALRHDQAVISHVGDSRCYLIRNGLAKQITQDHTWANDQKRLGLATEGEIDGAESRHVLTRALGPELSVLPDTTALTIQPGDVLVLCSDGLCGEMRASAIAAIVSQKKSMCEIARELVGQAVEMDGDDNATAIVIRIRSVEQTGVYRNRPHPGF